MLEGIVKCVWRKIADNDLKLKEQNKEYTLQSSCKCYDCPGYKTQCTDYQPDRKKPENEVKYRTNLDNMFHGVQ